MWIASVLQAEQVCRLYIWDMHTYHIYLSCTHYPYLQVTLAEIGLAPLNIRHGSNMLSCDWLWRTVLTMWCWTGWSAALVIFKHFFFRTSGFEEDMQNWKQSQSHQAYHEDSNGNSYWAGWWKKAFSNCSSQNKPRMLQKLLHVTLTCISKDRKAS